MTGVGGNQGDRLDSWKAIATYLGKDAGTVRRWERERGLPVHRVPGGKGTSVYAYSAEIDAWLQAAGQDPGVKTPIWPWAAVSAVIVVVLVLGWLIQRPSADAADVADLQLHMTDQALTAVDGEGKELWVRRLGDDVKHIKSEVGQYGRVTVGRNPRIFYITSHRTRRSDNTAESGEITSLDVQGNPRWTFRFFDNLLMGGKYYSEPWGITTFSVLEGDPPPRVAVAAHHWTWGASLIALLDDAGNRLGTYVNDGWIEQLHWQSPDRLVFGGFSESKNGGMVGLLDPKQLDGQSPETPGSPHYCVNCGKNPPLSLIVMPRSEVNLLTDSRFNRAIVEKTPDRLIVRTVEVPALEGQGAADAIYEFTTSLELVEATYSQRYWEIHDRLEREKKVNHGREHCPFKNGPREIHVWSPGSGWIVQPVR